MVTELEGSTPKNKILSWQWTV